MKRLTTIVLILTPLLGFTTMDQADNARWQQFIGASMNQWVTSTGLVPDNYFDDGDNVRVFVTRWQRPLGVCNIQLRAHFTGKSGGGSSSWTIFETVHQGPCGGI